MNIKVICISVTLLAVILGTSISAFGAPYSTMPEAAQIVVEQKYKKVIETLARDLSVENNLEYDLQNFEIGDAYKLYRIDNDKIAYKGMSISESLIPSDDWLVIIQYNGEPAGHLRIAHVDGQYIWDQYSIGGFALDLAQRGFSIDSSEHIRLFPYQGGIYSEYQNKIIEAPNRESLYLVDRARYETVMDGKTVTQIIKDKYITFQEGLKQNKEIEVGESGLWNSYKEFPANAEADQGNQIAIMVLILALMLTSIIIVFVFRKKIIRNK